MSKTARFLGGFSWGYRIRDRSPEPLPLKQLGVPDWNADARDLTRWYPEWDFG